MESRHSNVIGCLIWDLQETSKRRTNGTLWMRTTETSMWHTTDTSLGVSFDNCLRRRGEVLMGRRSYVLLRRRHDVPIRRHGDVPLRRLGDVPLIHRWVFHLGRTWYVAGTYRETSLQRHRDVMLPAGSSIILYSSTLAKQLIQFLYNLLYKNYQNNMIEKAKCCDLLLIILSGNNAVLIK